MQALSASDALGLLLIAVMTLPVAFAICLRLPGLVALSFVGVLFCFSSSTWGQLEADNTLYARGTGLFYFSLLNLLLWVAGAASLLRHLVNRQTTPTRSPFPTFFLLFLLMLSGHLALGMMAGQDVLVILGYSGIINVLNMLVFCVLLTMALANAQGRQRLLLMMLGLAAARAVFGMVRYVFLGGDSANPYRNFENLDITIFYFDIADNFVAALAAFCIVWLLCTPCADTALFM